MPYDSILVPTDGSDHAQRATAHALSLASTLGSDVHALGVIDVAAAAGPFDAGGVEPAFIQRLEEHAEENVEAVENQWAQPDRFHGDTRKGSPSQTILDYIEEAEIDIVAMGTHGRTGLRRFVLGSVTEHVIRESPVPVLTTSKTENQPPTLPYRNVLVTTDGSDCAARAVDHAIEIADACDATLHVLHAVEEAFVVGPDVNAPSDYLKNLETAGRNAVEDIADQAEAAGVDVRTAVEEGRSSDVIQRYAADNDIDMIAMGTHGRTGMDRVLLGSTTERLLRRSERAVLAVPARDTGEE
jgi:nucleotide-binding universal stress UspA family protein